MDVAAYVLGILDEPDEAAFAQHFATCRRCRTEYRELADLPMLLDQLKPARRERPRSRPPSVPGKRALTQALDQVTAARRARSRTLLLAAAAAVVLLVAIPLIVLRSAGKATQVAGPTVTVSAAAPTTTSTLATGTDVIAGARTVTGGNPANGITVTIGIEPASWGTKINLELRSTSGPVQQQLVAVARSGEAQVVTSWQVPAGGVGVPGASEPLRLQGNVGFGQEDIDRFQVRRPDGTTLLDVPA
ncbi:MAG: zf-HC2 domain-containing protein [Labedaea sp.]